MTKSQEKAIEKIRKLGEELFWGRADEYEFKEFDIKELNYGTISLVVETGMKNDEGTLAAIFARDRAHLFIGKRGGITYYDKTCNRKRFEGYSLLQAVIDQR